MPDHPLAKLARILIGVALLLPFVAQAQSDRLYRVELLVFSHPAGAAAEQWEATPDLVYPKVSHFLMDQDASSMAAPSSSMQPKAFITLPASQQEFRGAAGAMQRGGRYRLLFHEAWTQPITSQARALPIVLDKSGDSGAWPALQGSIKIYMSRYLYLETNLWLNTQGEYLHSTWRMPPPPLGPASTSIIEEAVLMKPRTPELDVTAELQAQAAPLTQLEDRGPVYPFRHAVLLQQTRRMRSSEVNYIDHPLLGVVVKISPLEEAEPITPAPFEAGRAPQPAP